MDVIELDSNSSDEEVLNNPNKYEQNSSYMDKTNGAAFVSSQLLQKTTGSISRGDFNLVDETYELVDPNPDIHDLFTTFDQQFFWGTLSSNACIVEWSKQMTSCAGICRFNTGNRLCCIRLSEPLLKLRPRRDLVETLLHEMIHAYLFITGGIQDRDGHGPDFQSHMHRINRLAGTSITIYHSFHAEVAHYKQHWWRCTGPCKDRPPFFGWVKRAMNRAPSSNDWWWKQHESNCSGTFEKVKEPEKKENGTKLASINGTKNSSSRKKSHDDISPGQQKIDHFFPGKGYVLGAKSSPTEGSLAEDHSEKPGTSNICSSVDPMTSDENITTKRKKRSKEEIEQEKMDKELNKIRRQIHSAKNTKCEQYLYCNFSLKILELDDSLKDELGKRFAERDISDQIIYDKSPRTSMQIFWRKKRLDAYLENGKLHKTEKLELQNIYCCVLSGEAYSALAKTKSNSLMKFLMDQLSMARKEVAEPKLTVIVFGKHHLRANNVCSLNFEAFEKHRIQFRFVTNAIEFSYLIVQYHKSLAKLEKKMEKEMEAEENGTNGIHFIAEKGISVGPTLVSDWWGKMLDHLHRMSEDQKRAIINEHPNPYRLMTWLLNNTPGEAMYALSEIKMENGRRLGPILAQKIYKMLTSLDGNESVD